MATSETSDSIPIRAAGCVVFCRDERGVSRVLLIQDKYQVWTLPKGHLEAGETEAEAACREVAEETGIDCVAGALVQRVQYPVFKKGIWHDKTVAYFLSGVEFAVPVPCTAEGISDARWFAFGEAIQVAGYAQVREVLRRARAMIQGEGRSGQEQRAETSP